MSYYHSEITLFFFSFYQHFLIVLLEEIGLCGWLPIPVTRLNSCKDCAGESDFLDVWDLLHNLYRFCDS